MSLDPLRRRWASFVASRRGRFVLSSARVVLSLGILGLLAYTLRGIDWQALWAELPANPLFYLLFLLLYLWLPLAEIVAYRVIWPLDAWKSLPVFIKKRIYNREVFQYSGEVYFFAWARKHVDRPAVNVAKDIRDQNIVSSVASTLVALVLVAAFLHLGEWSLTDWVGQQDITIPIGAAVVAVGLFALVIRFRKHILAMAPRTALLILGVHVGRFVFEQVLQIGMWVVAIPEVSLRVWCTYAALSLVISRIPLVTNRDLLFASISIPLAAGMAIPVEAIAALMLVVAGLGKVLTILFYTAFTLAGRTTAPRRLERHGAHNRGLHSEMDVMVLDTAMSSTGDAS
jgi:multisubunit Na+/H+ antiporter MnhB subunit